MHEPCPSATAVVGSWRGALWLLTACATVSWWRASSASEPECQQGWPQLARGMPCTVDHLSTLSTVSLCHPTCSMSARGGSRPLLASSACNHVVHKKALKKQTFMEDVNSKARKPQIKVWCLRPPERLGGGQMVARRTVSLAGLLGLGLAGVLAVVADPLPQLFNPSQGVMAAIRPIYPFVVLTQPLNALAFVWDGVLYGTGGFPYAATVRAASPQAGRK